MLEKVEDNVVAVDPSLQADLPTVDVGAVENTAVVPPSADYAMLAAGSFVPHPGVVTGHSRPFVIFGVLEVE